MTPAIETQVPHHIKSILSRLQELDCEAGRDAAALISAFVAQAAPDHITVCLTTNRATRGGVTVSLSPNQAVVVYEMAQRYPAVASVKQLHAAIWGAHAEKSINTVRVMMTDLRKRLKPLKTLIQNQNGHGYRLELIP